MSSHHQYECKLSLFFEETQLNRLPLAMMAIRAITQKPIDFFLKEYDEGKFDHHNVQNGVINEKNEGSKKQIFHSDDYLTLFNLVTHSERRDMLDIVTKYIFGGMLLRCLEAAGYFNCGNTEQGNSSEAEPNDSIDSRVPNDRIAIGW